MKAIEQSVRLKKLTLLVVFQIPLSFSPSLFNMSIHHLEQKMGVWWVFIVCVATTLFAYMLHLWDSNFEAVLSHALERMSRPGHDY